MRTDQLLRSAFRLTLCAGLGACTLSVTPSAHAATADAMTSAPLASSGDGSALRVRIAAAPNGCRWGDFDAIESEYDADKTSHVIASFEPIGSAGPAQVRELGKFDLRKGFVTTFDLPKGATGKHYGLYLCRDAKHTKRCSDKPAVSPEAVMNSHVTKVDPQTGKPLSAPSTAPIEDKSYYFGYFFVEGGQAAVFRSTRMPTDAASFTAAVGGTNAPAAVAKTVGELNAKLRSIQPTLDRDTWAILLPALDPQNCKSMKAPGAQ